MTRYYTACTGNVGPPPTLCIPCDHHYQRQISNYKLQSILKWKNKPNVLAKFYLLLFSVNQHHTKPPTVHNITQNIILSNRKIAQCSYGFPLIKHTHIRQRPFQGCEGTLKKRFVRRLCSPSM
jgi:hypothetical protein